MSKLGNALGAKYQENRISVMTRSFELGNHTFKVRVPSVGEIEAIYDYSKTPDLKLVQKFYKELSVDLLKFKAEPSDEVVFSDKDILVKGRSMLEAATNKCVFQHRVTEFIKFLIPQDGETFDGLTYADIEIEFPLAIQLTIIEKIQEVISPDYKEIRSKL